MTVVVPGPEVLIDVSWSSVVVPGAVGGVRR